MPRSKLLIAVSFLLACTLLPSLASAQTLIIGSGEVRRGSAVIIPVQFVPGDVPVSVFQTVIIYDPALFEEPTCVSHRAIYCLYNHDLGRLVVMHYDFAQPLTAQTYANIRFQFRSTVPRGTRAELGAYATEVYDTDVEQTYFTLYTGRIDLR